MTNRFGTYLAWLWAIDGIRGRKTNIHLYATEHGTPNGTHLEHIKGVIGHAHAHLHQYEFLSDVFIERYRGYRSVPDPLLAAEIEASPNHSVEYVYEGEGWSDYLWDFSKLLYVRARKRLFVACARKSHLSQLQTTLQRGYQDAGPQTSTEATAVVLLPAGRTEFAEVRFGLAANAELAFAESSRGGPP
jgi:hypothetical protein